MPLWLILLVISIATTVIGELLKPKNQKPTAGALGDFNFPTAEEGRAIPYVCGTVKIGGGNTVWWGDLKVVAIKKKASFLSFSSQTVGYKYFIGVEYALCHGDPSLTLLSIRCNNKALPYTSTTILNGSGSENYRQLIATGENLFGGTDVGGEGGFSGTIDFYRGLDSQQPNDYLTRVQGRVVVDQSGLSFSYHGIGDGTITFLSGGSSAKNETITATATTRSSGLMRFTIDGSISGHIGTATEGTAFTSGPINITIAAGATDFVTGDRFTILTKHANAAPSKKGICYAVLEQCYTGTTNYPKPFEVILRRCPDPFAQGDSVANINGDANPVLVIYELMTDDFFGLGIPPEKFDANVWKAAAFSLFFNEHLGIAFQQDSQDTADSIIGDILRHIDGLTYTDPTTGLWNISLTRPGYDPSTLLHLDETNVLEAIDYSRGSWEETSNTIVVSYLSRDADFTKRTVMDYDRANIEIRSLVDQVSVDYLFLSNPTNAALVASRHLKTMSSPIGKVKLICNRDAYKLRMGQPFLLSWASLGISNSAMRVAEIAYGEVRDGKITINAVEDIFGLGDTIFDSPPASGWTNPLGAPSAPANQRIVESPYKYQFDSGAGPGRFGLAMVQRGDPSSKWFRIFDVNASAQTVDQAPFTPTALLTADYPKQTASVDNTGFTCDHVTDIEAEDFPATIPLSDVTAGVYLAIIDDEIIGFGGASLAAGILTVTKVWRGVLDSVQAFHAASTPVYFLYAGAITTKSSPELTDTTLESKFLPENSIAVYPIGSASTITQLTRSRYDAPYPPGKIQINALSWGVVPGTITADLTISWATRNRLTQASLVKQDDGDVSPESGQLVRIEIRVGGVLKQSPSGLTSPYVYSEAQRVIDDPDITKAVEVKLWATRGGLDSYEFQTFTLFMAGPSGTIGPGRYEFATVDEGGLLL